MKELFLRPLSLHSLLEYFLECLCGRESNILILFLELYARDRSIIATRGLVRRIFSIYFKRSKLMLREDFALHLDYLKVTMGHWRNLLSEFLGLLLLLPKQQLIQHRK